MAEVRARFSLIDAISDKISKIAEAGRNMLDSFSQTEDAASSALDGIASSSSGAISAVDGIAKSLNDLNSSTSSAKTAADDLTGTLDGINGAAPDGVTDGVSDLENALEGADSAAAAAGEAADELASALDNADSAASQAASSADGWTDAIGNYDKGAMEFIYTLDELVDMGMKSSDTLKEQEAMFMLCEQSAGQLAEAIDASVSANDELATAVQQSADKMQSLGDNAQISAEAQEQLDTATQAAAQAMQELEAAQAEAEAAMTNYDAVIQSGTTDLGELEAAAERAGHASEALAEANYNASNAAGNLSAATEDAAKSAEEGGKSGVSAIEDIAQALAAVGLTAKVKEIAENVYELVDSFSEAEKVVVNATGATGDALDGLEESMVSAYAGHHQDLSTTAGAIGEINTRMGLTGQELSEVTGLFLDFNSITGSDAVTAVQNVTKVMNKWGVEQENVESVLDKLAYAGQISGASVDSLSQTLITGAASFQEMGLSLDNTISLLAAFELYGMNSTTAITAMRTAVRNFSDDGVDASEGLRQTIDEIANMESATEATALACDVFGTRAGVDMANAIRSGAISVDMLSGSLDEATGTLETTAVASESLGEKWEKSSNKMKAAFTSVIEPTATGISTKFADAVGNIGDFLNQHQALTVVLTAVGAGLGTVAIGIAAVAFASSSAFPAVVALASAVNAAIWPITLAAAAVTAVVGGVLLFSGALSNAEDEVEAYNGTMEECQNELYRTQSAYEKACEIYGEDSAAAMELADSLGTLHAQFEAGGGITAVYAEQAEKVAEAFHSISDAQQKAMEDIDGMQTFGLTTVAMLAAMSEQSQMTNADLDLMASYADQLNQEFNCNIKVNYDTGELTGFNVSQLTGAVIQAANDQRYQQAMEYLSGSAFQDNYVTAKQHIRMLEEELQGYTDELNYLYEHVYDVGSDGTLSYSGRNYDEIQADIENTQKAMDDYKSVLKEAEAEIVQYGDAIDATGAFSENFKETLDGIAAGTENATNAIAENIEALSEEEIGVLAANEAWQQYESDIEALAAAYEEAYNAAYESIHGQFSLFEQATTESETYMQSTVANAQAALQSQLDYWTSYGENIEVLKNKSADDLNITQAQYDTLMAYVQDGSEEAAGLADSMVSAIESGNTEAVSALAETLEAVNAKESEVSASVADWQTGFSQQMDEILNKMNSTVNDLDLSPEANRAATATMNSYTSAITSAGAGAVAAAKSIANQVVAALSSANTTINIGVSGSVPGHATGTTNAEDVFIAGENGPELVVGKAGSTVFPASDTNRIISALNGMDGTAYGDTYENTTNNHAEVVNNYTTVEDTSSHDDERLLYLLSGFVTMLSSIEGKLDKGQYLEPGAVTLDAYASGTTDSADTFIAGENGPELIIGQPESKVFPATETERIITALTDSDLTGELAAIASTIQPTGDEISNYDQSITYGDAPDYSHEYQTDYGDRIYNAADIYEDDHSSRTTNTAANYEDNSRRLSTALTEGDRAYTEYSSASNYGTTYETAVRYGDSYQSAAEGTQYGDTIQNHAETVMQPEDGAHSFEDASYVAFFPLLPLFEAILERALTGNLDAPQAYIDNTYETADTAAALTEPEFELPELVSTINTENVENPIVGVDDEKSIALPESDGKPVASGKEESTKRIIIEIAGSGEIDISGGINSEDVLEILQENLKPVLMGIIQTEMYEEGDGAYDY